MRKYRHALIAAALGVAAIACRGESAVDTPPPPITITTPATLPQATLGAAYEVVLQASGVPGQGFQWEVTDGALPAGLTLSTAGVVSGMPLQPAQARFTVRATQQGRSATAELMLVVDFRTLVVTTTGLALAILGRGYTQLLNATGGDTTQQVQWTLVSGTMPAGVTLGAAGTVTGNPVALGAFDFMVRATRGSRTAEQSLQLRVEPPPLGITTDMLPPARVGVPYIVQLEAVGGVAERSWSLSSGRLPAGLALGGNGLLSGTGTAEDSSAFTVEVTSGTQRVTRVLTLVVEPSVFPASAIVDMPGDVFAPFLVRVRVGGVVTWRFPVREHNVIFAPAVGAPADINIVSNVEVSRTFTRPGEFRYDCTIHPGMAGRVEVR